jgi:hypothetical protein
MQKLGEACSSYLTPHLPRPVMGFEKAPWGRSKVMMSVSGSMDE